MLSNNNMALFSNNPAFLLEKAGLLILEEGITYFTVTLAALLPTWMI